MSARHAITIAASRERVWEALRKQDLGQSPIAQALLFLRGYGFRARAAAQGEFSQRLQRFGFILLWEEPGRELVFGLAGRFWRPGGGLRRLASAEEFRRFAEDGAVKAAWNLHVLEAGANCTLSTETRVLCFGRSARRKFRLYWSFIAPFSGAIRMALLRGVRRGAEGPARGPA